jgi:ribosomal protein L11 methyltransferase
MNHIQLTIEATGETQDILISELSELAATGFEQADTHLLAYFNEADFNSYEINAVLQDYRFTLSEVPQQNWNELWEKAFEPVVVGDFCAIRAHFHPPVKDVQHEVVITPKMSFGTGHHATTFMMVQQMETIDCKGKSVFDFGTGTGILAILAHKSGAASVVAIDIDEWSIQNAEENAVRNHCHNLSFRLTSDLPNQPFDIILANINRNVILQYLPQLAKISLPNGLLLLSGLLVSDKADIVSACKSAGFCFQKGEEKGGWISLLFVNQL